jgi:hypothetical protein
MSDSQSLNTSLPEVIICPKNDNVFICDLNDLMLQIIFDGWWTSMNVGSKRSIAWNHFQRTYSWWLFLRCGLEDNSCPGIICIVCHQVLRHPSEHGTSTMRNHLLANKQIAMLNQLPESEGTKLTSSTVDETALAILKRQGSREILIVRSKRKFVFDI